ncbi:unnamed protein product, partial [Didymodactylos carnosus]
LDDQVAEPVLDDQVADGAVHCSCTFNYDVYKVVHNNDELYEVIDTVGLNESSAQQLGHQVAQEN